MKPAKRSRVLISMFQVRLLLLSIAYLITLALALGAILFWPLAQRVDDVQLAAAERATAAAELLALHARFWPAFGVIAATFLAHQMIVSHRIAGPLHRVRQVLKALARGELPGDVRFRKRDLLTEEADDLNALIAAWRARLQRARSSLEQAQSLAARWDSSESVDQHDSKAQLAAALDRVSQELDSFDSGGPRREAPLSSDSPPAALPRAMSGAAPQVDVPKGSERSSSSRTSHHNSEGFTLIELMIVVAILAVVAGLAIPGYRAAVKTARMAVAMREIHLLMNEIDLYELREGQLPTSLADIGRGGIRDPWGNPYSYVDLATAVIPGGGGQGGGNGGFGGSGSPQGGGSKSGGSKGGSSTASGSTSSGSTSSGSTSGGSTSSGSTSSGSTGSGSTGSGSTAGGSTSSGSNTGGSNTGGANTGGANAGGANAGGPNEGNAGGAIQPRKDRFLVPINSDYDLYSMGADGRSVAPLTASMSRDDIIRANDGAFVGLAEDY